MYDKLKKLLSDHNIPWDEVTGDNFYIDETILKALRDSEEREVDIKKAIDEDHKKIREALMENQTPRKLILGE